MADLKIALARQRLYTIATGTTGTGDSSPDDDLAFNSLNTIMGQDGFDAQVALVSDLTAGAHRFFIQAAAMGFKDAARPLSIECLLLIAHAPSKKKLVNINNWLESFKTRCLDAAQYPAPPAELIATEVQWPRPEISHSPEFTLIRQLVYVLFPAP